MTKELGLSFEMAGALKMEISDASPEEDRELKNKVGMIQQAIEACLPVVIDKKARERVKGLVDRVMVTNDSHFVQMFYEWEGGGQLPEEMDGVDWRRVALSELGARYYTGMVAAELGWRVFVSSTEKEMSQVYEELVGRWGVEVHRLFFDHKNVDELVEKLILADFDKSVGVRLAEEWGYRVGEEGSESGFNPNVFGALYTTGGVVVLRRADPFWQNLEMTGRQTLIGILGSEDKARVAFTEAVANYYLIHEVIHAYEAD